MLYEIIELILAPLEAAKRQAEDSNVGQSELDRSGIKFWKLFAWIAFTVVIGIPAAGWILWKLITT